MKFNGRLIVFTLVLVALATACKFSFGDNLNWSGFSPIIAIALFSGYIIPQKNRSFLFPLLAVFLSDCVIELLYRADLFAYGGFYSGQWKNYAILLVSTLIGWALKGRSYESLALGSVAAPTSFFLLSNLNVWLSAEVVYSRDFSGLISCYTAGLPFYRNALVATVVFLPVIILLYNFLLRQRTSLKLA